jgi:hypothetical protein
MIFTPVRLDRLQRSLVQVFEDGTGLPTHWAQTEPSHETLPDDYLVLDMVVPPGPWNQHRARGVSKQVVTSTDIVVDSSTLNQLYAINLNHFQYREVGQVADTVTTIRDRLIAQINDDLLEPVTASIVSGDTLRLTADFDGAIRALTLSPHLSVAAQVLSNDIVLLIEGTQTCVVNVEAISKEQSPMNGAASKVALAYAVLQSPDYVATLNSFGVGVWDKGVPIAVPVVNGARWETQDSFDLTLALQAAWVRPSDAIESVGTTITLQPGDIETVATVP